MPSLTHTEAQARAAGVADLSYQLDVDLTGGADAFRTTTTVRFAARGADDLFLEVRPERLLSATLNGADVSAHWALGRLALPGLIEQNEVVVTAEYAYSHSSEGMHRFRDPADGADYVYAQPSIANAPCFMACFDQPDLKAPVTLSVTGDPSWLVRANTTGAQVAPGRWEFAPSLPIATYLITFTAGPLVEVRDEHDGIPLGLYARASYGDVLRQDAPEVLAVTKACLDEFHRLFGVRYPFGKYDQVFMPEFSWGAMEFPGCVVFRDEYLFRAGATDTERLKRASTIAHEMAHMWFGDLVTMRWWDDLWLNESFAEYMGYRLVADVTKWTQSWANFGLHRKNWGYAADQRPSTHPVAPAEVADTDAAYSNFDGISYAKGCSALRQLVSWIGDEAFFRGLRSYFEKHAWGNATLADLLDALSVSSGRDLHAWAELWLRTPQVNTLRPQISWAADGTFANVTIEQSAHPDYPTLRPHKIGIGWLDSDLNDSGQQWRRTQIEIAGRTTDVPQLAGKRGEALLLNDLDLTFAKVRVDERTRAQLGRLLLGQEDPLTRALLWNAAWDSVRDAEWPAEEFIDLVAQALSAEPDVTIVESVLALAHSAAFRALPLAAGRQASATVAQACRDLLVNAAPGSDLQLAGVRGLVAHTAEADAGWLGDWLQGSNVPDGLVIDADLRWKLAGRLAALGHFSEADITAELARDTSDRGEQEAAHCRASRPDPAAKEYAFEVVVHEQGLSNRIVTATGAGMWQPEQGNLTHAYISRFFAELPTSAGRSGDLLYVIGHAAYPAYPVTLDTARQAELALAGPLHPRLRRALSDETDDLRRSLRAHQASRST